MKDFLKMKKTILIIFPLLLFGVCIPLSSASVNSRSAGGIKKVQTYVDPASIKKKADNKANMWVLDDYEALQRSQGGHYYNSQKTLYEFNCKENKFNIRAIVSYSGNMGKGDVVHMGDFSEDDGSPWMAIVPNSRSEMNFEFACGME